MNRLLELFGPSKEQIWMQLAAEMGGRFVDGGWFGKDRVQARTGDWIVTLDTYTVSSGKSSTTYTRIRAPFINRDGFRFTIYRSGLFTELGKLFGLRDVEIGARLFDEQFVIQGNDERKLRELFSNPRIQQLLTVQPAVHLRVAEDEGWFGPQFPEGVDELVFQVHGVIRELPRLRALYELFSEILHQLCHMDSAYRDDATLLVDTLLGPGGRITSEQVLLWEGDSARRAAAERLGRLKEPRGVPALVKVLEDPDAELRLAAIRALGEIGDPRAVPALLPFLGETDAGRPGGSLAAEALRKMGAAEVVGAFEAALRGDLAGLELLKQPWRAPVIAGFVRALEHPNPAVVIYALRALRAMGAVEAAPAIRERSRRLGGERATRAEFAEALAELRRIGALPRPAAAPAIDPRDLPRPAEQPGSDTPRRDGTS